MAQGTMNGNGKPPIVTMDAYGPKGVNAFGAGRNGLDMRQSIQFERFKGALDRNPPENHAPPAPQPKLDTKQLQPRFSRA